MKQIYPHIFAAAVAVALTLAGCDKEDNEPDSDVAPAFTATIEGGPTRAYDTTWETGDEIGIFCTNASYGIKNMGLVTADDQGAFTLKDSEEQIYYKANSMTFFAYYPYKDIGEISSTNKTINFDTSDQKKQKSFDFLYSPSVNGTKANPGVEFKFTHKMSKVTFIFKNGQKMDVSKIVSYTLGNLYLEGTFTLCNISSSTSTVISVSGTVSAITSGKVPDVVGLQVSDVEDGKPAPPLILIPQTVPSGTSTTSLHPVTLEIERNDGQRFTAPLTFPNNKIEAGKNYIFTITVNSSGLIVSDFSITGWDDYIWPEGGGQGSAISADDPDEEMGK